MLILRTIHSLDYMSTELITSTQTNQSRSLVQIKPPDRISARELHKYVVGLVGMFMLCLVTYPIAIYRVTQQEKFASSRSHLKSLTADYKSIKTDKTAN
jgi:hypothetical protein